MLKKIWNNRKTVGYIALALACVMIGSMIGAAQPAQAANSVMTSSSASPFTAPIAQVMDSVVGVNNYQLVSNSYGNGYGSYGFPWSDFFGYGYPYGNGNGNNPNSGREIKYGSGSGVVVAKEYVMTNYHVVEGASSLEVSVTREGKEDPDLLKATVAASNEDLDVAVLYVPGLDLNPVELGDSDALQVGDLVFNIGNPIGFDGTVTAGIISGLNREISTGTSTDRYGRKTKVVNTMIQTDAAINSGNSGGGMFNVAGQLVGIPTLKYSGSRFSSGAAVESIGMCIPINEAKDLIEEALTGEKPAVAPGNATEPGRDNEGQQSGGRTGKPRLGVTVTTLNDTDGVLPNGAYIVSVEAGSPADKAGLQGGDILVEVNGNVIASSSELMDALEGSKEGDTVTVTVWRPAEVRDAEHASISTDGEYVENIEVGLAMLDNVAQ